MTDTEALIASRLVLVTGKGGTGKTTFASALALLAAARGRRVLLCEIDAQHSSLAGIFGVRPGFEPRSVRTGLDVANVTFEEALRSFLVELVPSRRVVGMVLDNPAARRFLDFTPGSRELVVLSALGHRVERYDLVVVDMPASGHAFSLLDITRSALGLFRSGPVRRRAAQLRKLLVSPGSRVALVVLPEEMAVNETLETRDRLRAHELLGQPPVVFLNRATTPSMGDLERTLLARLSDASLDDRAAEFVRAGRWEARLERGTAEAVARLAAIADPVLVPPVRAGSPPATVVTEVAVSLGRTAGVTRRDLQSGGLPAGAVEMPRAPVDATPKPLPAHWLDDLRLVVCVGAGGVGKTTSAAALALQGALRGRKAIVLTIDPARRLANSLGIAELGNTAQRIPLEGAPGELWAMMLDSRQAFDELLERILPDEAARDRVRRNHVYRHMSEAFAGSQDYVAAEKLHDLVTSGRWDLVVLDTPPVKNALDFLESPGRLVHFLDERILRWFLHPYDPSHLGGRLMLGTSAVVYKLLGYVFGTDFLDDLGRFFRDFDGLYQGFRERHQAVLDLFHASDTAFLTVCAPTETTLDVARFFLDELRRRALPCAGVLVNQVHRCQSDDHDASVLEGALRRVAPELTEAEIGGFLARLGMAHRRLREVALADTDAVARLRTRLDGAPCVEVPRLETEVHDLDTLGQVALRIGGRPVAQPAPHAEATGRV